MRSLVLCCLLLTACGRPPVAPALRAEVEAFVASDQSPGAPRLLAAWHPPDVEGGLVCGEIDAQAALGGDLKKLRLVYDPASKHGQIELHSNWRPFTSRQGSLLYVNRAEFEAIWGSHCG